MKPIKRTLSVAICAAMLFGFAACGGGSESETTSAATEQASAVNAGIESTVAVTERDDDPTFLTLFRYPDSKEYKAIKKAEKIETGIVLKSDLNI